MSTSHTYDTPVTDDGDYTSIDVHGHLTPEEVEAFLWEVERDPYEYTGRDDPELGRAMAVEHLWRWKRPADEDEGDELEYYYEYSARQVPDSIPVTRFDLDAWGRTFPNCAFHPSEPSTSGLSRYMWPEGVAHMAITEHGHEYLYVCHACQDTLNERLTYRTQQFTDHHSRLTEAGVPEHLIWRTSEDFEALGTPPAPPKPPREINIRAPHVHYGPDGVPPHHATADYLREVVSKIDSGHTVVGGSNVTAAVRALLLSAAVALREQERTGT